MKKVGVDKDITIVVMDSGMIQMNIWDDEADEAVVYRTFINKESMVKKFTELFAMLEE